LTSILTHASRTCNSLGRAVASLRALAKVPSSPVEAADATAFSTSLGEG